MRAIQQNALGIGICALIALPCWFLGEAIPVVGGPVFAILLGMIIALFWKQPSRGSVQTGIGFTAKKILQYAVILLGFGEYFVLRIDFLLYEYSFLYSDGFKPTCFENCLLKYLAS